MKDIKTKKPTFDLWEVLVIALVSALIMSGVTGYTVYRNNGAVDCSSLAENPHVGEFLNSYNAILNEFYTDVDENGLVGAAINGMMSYLGDPYTTYLNESNSSSLTDSLKGTYYGIGIGLSDEYDRPVTISKVYRDTPASKAGLKDGDLIIRVNGNSTDNKSSSEIIDMIKDDQSKTISISILRDNQELTFNVTKETLLIPINDQVFERNNQKVGYIQFSTFTDSIGAQFTSSLNALEEQKIDSLIIDLRDNTGGYLKGAVDISSLFLKHGALIYSLRTKLETTPEKVTASANKNYKIYILINKNSASASEVLAAALKYNASAVLVGETSYGKGKVQHTSKTTSGGMLKYTTAEWLTPKGDCIEGVGLEPDIPVEFDFIEGNSYSVEEDVQLQTAINKISER